MLSSIRKFSTSIYAKVLLGIVVIPFVFWGMGSAFKGGNKNIIVQIDGEKHSVQDFASYIQSNQTNDRKINSADIDNFLTIYIGDKLIEKEYESFGIKISDKSLGKLIKNQKEFKRENKFSRTEYEKFLLSNNFIASNFELMLSNQEKKKQLLDLIGGGISPPKFLVDSSYNSINQKREIELLDINDIFNKETKIEENKIITYFEKNKKNYKDVYKSISILEITPIKLINNNDYTDLFFKKIDDIDNRIAEGKSFKNIINEFDLPNGENFKINKLGEDLNSNVIDLLPKDIIKYIFDINDSTLIALYEIENKFFILEIIKTEEIQKNLKDQNVKKNIKENLKMLQKRKFISEIISKLNQNNFTKLDFDKLSVDKNILIKKILINDRNDNKILKSDLLREVFASPEKKIIMINDIGLTENYLIYIDKVKNASIDDNPNEYEKYVKLSKAQITGRLFNTYDLLIKKKYKIDINYNALKTVKNYFN